MNSELVIVVIMTIVLSVVVFIDQHRKAKRNASEPRNKNTQSHYEYTQTKEMPALDHLSR